MGEVHAPDDRPHTGTDDGPNRKPRLVEHLQYTEMGKTAGAATTQCENGWLEPPRRPHDGLPDRCHET
jgi:hypothetical protein